MALLTIPGMTEDALLNTSTAPTGGGLRPFPCDAGGWTKQTAVVVKCELKTFVVDGAEKSSISIMVANDEYGAECLVDLDTNNTAPGCKDVAKQRQQNLSDLMKVIKILGAHTGAKFDTDKLAKAHGQTVEIIVKHKGFRGGETKAKFNHRGENRRVGFPCWDGKETLFHDVQAIFKGEVEDLEEVNDKGLPPMPTAPGAAPTAPRGPGAPAGGFADPFAGQDDVPF